MDMFMQNMAMQNMIKPGTQTGSAGSMGSAAQPGTPDGEGGNVFSSMIEQMNQSLHSSGKHPVSPIFPGKAQPDGQEEAAAAYAGSNAAQTLLWWNIPVPETISPVQTGQSETSMQPLTMASALTGAASADTVAADSAGYQTASDKMGIPNPGDSMASVHLTVESPDGQDQGAMPVNAENYSFADQGQTSGTYGNLQKSGISNAAEVSVDAVSGSKGDDIAEEKGGQDISPIKSEVTGEALSTHPAGASDVRENIRAGAAESTPVSETLHLSGTDRASDIQKLLEMTDKPLFPTKGKINLQLEPKNLERLP